MSDAPDSTATPEPARVITSSSAPAGASMPTAPDASAAPSDAPAKRVGLPPGSMTQAHKDALAAGRRRGQIVRAYLKAVADARPKRGRPITKDGLRKRIAELDRDLKKDHDDPLKKLDLVQRRIDAQKKLDEFDAPVDLTKIEKEFVKEARAYGEAKGISAEAWIEMGVPRDVLKRAKIVD
jgi:hypothetical protein